MSSLLSWITAGSSIFDSREFPPKRPPSGWWGDGELQQEPVPKRLFLLAHSEETVELLLLGLWFCGSKVSAPGPASGA